MAPELYEEAYDEGVDIYAFGMCVLEMLSNETPYSECRNPGQIFLRVTKGFPPKLLSRVKHAGAKAFIELCVGRPSEGQRRPKAEELLQHPFLTDDDPEDENDNLIAPPDPDDTLDDADSCQEEGTVDDLPRQEDSRRSAGGRLQYGGAGGAAAAAAGGAAAGGRLSTVPEAGDSSGGGGSGDGSTSTGSGFMSDTTGERSPMPQPSDDAAPGDTDAGSPRGGDDGGTEEPPSPNDTPAASPPAAAVGGGGGGDTSEEDYREEKEGGGGRECSVCLEMFAAEGPKTPMLLPCGHSLSLDCLEMMLARTPTEETAVCPRCRRVCPVGVGGVASFSKNFDLIEFIESAAARQPAAAPEDTPATVPASGDTGGDDDDASVALTDSPGGAAAGETTTGGGEQKPDPTAVREAARGDADAVGAESTGGTASPVHPPDTQPVEEPLPLPPDGGGGDAGGAAEAPSRLDPIQGNTTRVVPMRTDTAGATEGTGKSRPSDWDDRPSEDSGDAPNDMRVVVEFVPRTSQAAKKLFLQQGGEPATETSQCLRLRFVNEGKRKNVTFAFDPQADDPGRVAADMIAAVPVLETQLARIKRRLESIRLESTRDEGGGTAPLADGGGGSGSGGSGGGGSSGVIPEEDTTQQPPAAVVAAPAPTDATTAPTDAAAASAPTDAAAVERPSDDKEAAGGGGGEVVLTQPPARQSHQRGATRDDAEPPSVTVPARTRESSAGGGMTGGGMSTTAESRPIPPLVQKALDYQAGLGEPLSAEELVELRVLLSSEAQVEEHKLEQDTYERHLRRAARVLEQRRKVNDAQVANEEKKFLEESSKLEGELERAEKAALSHWKTSKAERDETREKWSREYKDICRRVLARRASRLGLSVVSMPLHTAIATGFVDPVRCLLDKHTLHTWKHAELIGPPPPEGTPLVVGRFAQPGVNTPSSTGGGIAGFASGGGGSAGAAGGGGTAGGGTSGGEGVPSPAPGAGAGAGPPPTTALVKLAPEFFDPVADTLPASPSSDGEAADPPLSPWRSWFPVRLLAPRLLQRSTHHPSGDKQRGGGGGGGARNSSPSNPNGGGGGGGGSASSARAEHRQGRRDTREFTTAPITTTAAAAAAPAASTAPSRGGCRGGASTEPRERLPRKQHPPQGEQTQDSPASQTQQQQTQRGGGSRNDPAAGSRLSLEAPPVSTSAAGRRPASGTFPATTAGGNSVGSSTTAAAVPPTGAAGAATDTVHHLPSGTSFDPFAMSPGQIIVESTTPSGSGHDGTGGITMDTGGRC